MMHSIKSWGLVFGSAALLALVGCQPKSKQSAAAPPPYEPGVSTGQQPGATSETERPSAPSNEMGMPMDQQHPEAGAGEPGAAPRGQPGAATPGAPEHMGAGQGTSEAAPQASERTLCDALMRHARLHIEDVQGGVAIVAKPRASADLSRVREDMEQIDRRMSSGATPSAGEACELVAIGRSGALAAVTVAPDAIRILLTSPDATQVKAIRKQARDFVNTASKSEQGSPPGQGKHPSEHPGTGAPSGSSQPGSPQPGGGQGGSGP